MSPSQGAEKGILLHFSLKKARPISIGNKLVSSTLFRVHTCASLPISCVPVVTLTLVATICVHTGSVLATVSGQASQTLVHVWRQGKQNVEKIKKNNK